MIKDRLGLPVISRNYRFNLTLIVVPDVDLDRTVSTLLRQ